MSLPFYSSSSSFSSSNRVLFVPLAAPKDAEDVISYHPRAAPCANRLKCLVSAESAIHTPRMKQAVGLQTNQMTLRPRALPWAGMKQAFGLRRQRAAPLAASMKPEQKS